ncbi:FMN-dependent 2-nitropropane dioxygenase [Podospora didyma]|uniref:FMN-dependent 2-nitropropane dioxygenase n=1 Tax=Podospora didyma TaxID=330526 RepID=A0AAE0NGT1_9PEZI|nr:FMN-dependent 2-nitropropane dioxygenase [Podospora didyma]
MSPHHRKPEVVASKLNGWFPNTKNPVIISAPMLGVSNGTLAANVSLAGGFGMVPGAFNLGPDSPDLATLSAELTTARRILGLADRPLTPIPVGVGFILCDSSASHFLSTVIPPLQDHSPQAVWLFAPDLDAEEGFVRGIIDALHASGFIVFFQVGSVAAARKAVQDGADVIVAQGIDAGGHQAAIGSGVVSLVPEVVSMVEDEFKDRGVVVVAAGGIVDGRGVAAVLALGAEAAVMGTRFLVAPEASTADYCRKLILETVDGGVSTAKSSFHDNLQGPGRWPAAYDGRAIVTELYRDHIAGVSLEESQARFSEAKAAGDLSRQITWAGTGIGLVKDARPAGEIVTDVREAAKKRFHAVQSLFQ